MCASVLYNDGFNQKIKILLLYINYIDLGGGGGHLHFIKFEIMTLKQQIYKWAFFFFF